MTPQAAGVEQALSPWMPFQAMRVNEAKFNDLLKCNDWAVDNSPNYTSFGSGTSWRVFDGSRFRIT